MISFTTYKIIHLLGVFLILMSLGALCFHFINGGHGKPAQKKFLAMGHGIGLLLAILGGFGMLAKQGITHSMPGWVFAKLAIWLVLGGMLALIPRRPQLAGTFWWLTVALGGLGGWIALTKLF